MPKKTKAGTNSYIVDRLIEQRKTLIDALITEKEYWKRRHLIKTIEETGWRIHQILNPDYYD